MISVQYKTQNKNTTTTTHFVELIFINYLNIFSVPYVLKNLNADDNLMLL